MGVKRLKPVLNRVASHHTVKTHLRGDPDFEIAGKFVAGRNLLWPGPYDSPISVYNKYKAKHTQSETAQEAVTIACTRVHR